MLISQPIGIAWAGVAHSLVAFSCRGDTFTTFEVSGTAENVLGTPLDSCAFGATCDFSGTFQIDLTSGMVESSAFHFTFPGLEAIDTLFIDGPIGPDWVIDAHNSSNTLFLSFAFTTGQTPASLVGFAGGPIVGGTLNTSTQDLYFNFAGNITPVPEP